MSSLQEKLDAASARYENQSAKLLREDGSRCYSDTEHAERQAALRRELGEALDAIEAEADEQISSAEATLARYADRSALLSTEELTEANGRRPFVSEDAENLPLEDLAARAEAAASSGDKASMFLYARYGGQRAQQERSSSPGVEFTPAFERLEAALAGLEEGLSSALERKARQAIEEAREVKGQLYLRRRGATTPLQLVMNQRYAYHG